MSSPAHDEPADDPKVDELEETADGDTGEGEEAAPAEQTVKRKRGRPPGSKNKKTLAAEAAGTGASPEAPAVPRKRGRPPKRKPEEDPSAEPPVKRKRGRPPKPKPPPPEDGNGEPSGESSAPKRKRGRPRKDAS